MSERTPEFYTEGVEDNLINFGFWKTVLTAERTQRCVSPEITIDVRANIQPRLYSVKLDDTIQTEYQRTYIEDLSYWACSDCKSLIISAACLAGSTLGYFLAMLPDGSMM